MKYYFYLNFRLLYAAKLIIIQRFTRGGILVLTSIICCAVMGLDTNRTLTYQIFTFLTFILLISMVLSLTFRAKFTTKRILPKFGTAGVPLTYKILIQNHSSKQQKYLSLIENQKDPRPDFDTFLKTPEQGEEKRNIFDRFMKFYRWEWIIAQKTIAKIKPQLLPVLQPKEQQIIKAEIKPLRRGILNFTGMTISRTDPFGLFNSFFYISLPQSIVILPQCYTLPLIHLSGTRQYQSGGVALTSSVGDSEEFISLRNYRPGDPLRRIHWKTWAKTGKPVVKEYQGEFYVRHGLILDTFQKSKYSQIFEEAVSVAASFACTVQTRESLLDLMFVGTKTYCFTTGRSIGHLDKALEILASVQPCLNKSFENLSSMVIERASSLSGCICIFLKWDKTRKQLVSRLRSINIPVIVLIISEPDSNKNQDLGPMIDMPQNFHILEIGKIKQGLAGL